MPEESETATFGVIKPAQEVRNARTDAPLGGPVAHDRDGWCRNFAAARN
jgi:hypothetical protein